MSLEERLEQGIAPAWRPDQDDPEILIGEVVDIDVGNNDYGSYPILTIRLDNGTEKALHGMQTVLRNELIRQKPKIGERIGVKYLGEQKTKPGSRFKSYTGYTVKVDRQAGAFDWSKLGAEPDPTDINPAYQGEPEPEPVAAPAGAGDDEIPGIPF